MRKLKCLRCGHRWISELDHLPKQCPNIKCHSPYWNKERRIPGEAKLRRLLREVGELRLWTEADKFFNSKQSKMDFDSKQKEEEK
jgi:hypothetical protein